MRCECLCIDGIYLKNPFIKSQLLTFANKKVMIDFLSKSPRRVPIMYPEGEKYDFPEVHNCVNC